MKAVQSLMKGNSNYWYFVYKCDQNHTLDRKKE